MINLYHLKYFCDACRAESISKSAELNRITHSAISQAIRSLEREIGAQLVQHARRSFVLTHEGKKLYENSDAVFDSIQNTINLAKTDKKSISGTLCVGFSHSIGKHLLAKKLTEFSAKNANVTVQVSIGNSKALETLLASKEIEVGFGIEDGNFAQYERKVLSDCPFVLIERKTGERHRDVFLVGDKGSEVRAVRAHFRKKKQPPVFHQIQSWTMVHELVLQGWGVGLVPEFVYKSDRQNLSLLSTDIPLPQVKLCAFYRSHLNLSSASQAFITMLDRP